MENFLIACYQKQENLVQNQINIADLIINVNKENQERVYQAMVTFVYQFFKQKPLLYLLDTLDFAYHIRYKSWEVLNNIRSTLLKNFSINDALAISLPRYVWHFAEGTPENYIANDFDTEFAKFYLLSKIIPEKKVLKFSIFEENMENGDYVGSAAYFGSLKCFKFLMMNHAEIDDEHCKYAVAGGNKEIFDILEQKGKNFTECVEISAVYHQRELFLRLYDKYAWQDATIEDIFAYNNELILYFYMDCFPCLYNKAEIKNKLKENYMLKHKPCYAIMFIPDEESSDIRFSQKRTTEQWVKKTLVTQYRVNDVTDMNKFIKNATDVLHTGKGVDALSIQEEEVLGNCIIAKRILDILMSVQFITFCNEVNAKKQNFNKWNTQDKIQLENQILYFLDSTDNIEYIQKHITFEVTPKTIRKYIRDLCDIDASKFNKQNDTEGEATKIINSTAHSIYLQSKDANAYQDSNEYKREQELVQLAIKCAQEISKDEPDHSALKTITKLYIDAISNKNRGPNGYRHDPDLRPLFILFSLYGQRVYESSIKSFQFPAYSTVSGYRDEFEMEKFGVILRKSTIFDGTYENIKKIIDAIYEGSITNSKVVLAIDAVIVQANAVLDSKGDFSGFINEVHLSDEDTSNLINNPDEFNKYIKEHYKDLTHAFFTILLIPLRPTSKPFPISITAAHSGTATDSIIQHLEDVKNSVSKCGITVTATASDGDNKYMKAAIVFVNYILKHENPDEVITENYAELNFAYHYYDAIHLGKNNRNYYSDVANMYVWPTEGAPKICKQEFIDSGIFNCDKLLTAKQSEKMSDKLPKGFFTPENVLQLYQKEKKYMAVVLLPTTLLFEAIYNTAIDRSKRIEYLSIGYAIVLLYIRDYHNQKNDTEYAHPTTRDKARKKVVLVWPLNWCSKYLELTFCLIKEIALNEPIHLGALGTHLLEHYFGYIRLMAHDDKSPQQFIATSNRALLYREACDELGLNSVSTKRESDSGAKLFDKDANISQVPLGANLFTAYLIVKDCGVQLYKEEVTAASYSRFEENVKIRKVSDLFTVTPKVNTSMSLKKELHSLTANASITVKQMINGDIGKKFGQQKTK